MRTAALMGLLGVLLLGCAGHSLRNVDEEGFPVALLNHDLERTIKVDRGIREERDCHGLKKIRVKIKNITEREIIHLQVQTVWSDAVGKALNPDPSWQNLALTPGQAVCYEDVSSSSEAEKYLVRVRYLVSLTSRR